MNDNKLSGKLSGKLKLIYDTISDNPGIKSVELSERLNIPYDTINKNIGKLTALSLIERRGSRKTGGYFTLTD
ncbi:MAG: winged helix-turn-helix transcriptional regulator [Bacteroidetes bacterium]|nr:winged helix-turn-helix transcriptional regulator [Bacteroidota bacterium]